MNLDLASEIMEQFERVKRLAEEADYGDTDDSLSGRAAAMRPLTSMLKELTESQALIVNMKRLNAIEAALIESAKENFDEFQMKKFVDDVELRLNRSDT